jgi:hypothetical protein
MAEQVTGTVVVRLDNKSIRSKSGAKLSLGGLERSPEYADGVLIGYSARPIAATVTCTLVLTTTSDLDAINRSANSTILFECDNGITYMIANAFSVKPPEITGGNGEVSVEFSGQPSVRTL